MGNAGKIASVPAANFAGRNQCLTGGDEMTPSQPSHRDPGTRSGRMIVIIDYGMGNLRSVQKAIEAVGSAAEITSDPDRVGRRRK